MMVDVVHDGSLTMKQEAFILAYVGEARGNATLAAKMAGYAESGASEEGYRLMRNPKIRARIDEYLKDSGPSTAEIIAELWRVAMAPTTHFMQVLQAEYTDDKGVTHKAIIRQDYTAKVNALKLLGQACGMFNQIDVHVHETKTIVGVDIADVTGRRRKDSE